MVTWHFSANILLDKDFVPKLGDFATTRLGPSGDGNTQAGTSILIGTSAYLAPEAHNFDVSAKLDSFSFGVVRWDTDHEPFQFPMRFFALCNVVLVQSYFPQGIVLLITFLPFPPLIHFIQL